MKTVRFILLYGAAMLALMPQQSVAQSRVGTTAATFLTLGTGARGTSLGHAYTALATGADALFWNPGAASIAAQGRFRGGAFFTHHDWLADINYNALGVVFPITGTAVIGLSLQSVDYGTMDVRTVTRPEGTGETFGASDLAMGLTYAMPLTPSFNFGGTVKYIHQGIRDMSASAFAFDFGFVLVTDYFRGLQVAASIQNFGGKMQMNGVNSELLVDVDAGNTGTSESIPARIRMDSWDLPLSFKFGVALPVIETSNMRFMALADANQTNDNNLNADLGGELSYFTRTVKFDLRIGYKDANLDNVDSHLSYGAGIDLQVSRVRFGFDFAYVPFDFLDDVRMFDFRVHF